MYGLKQIVQACVHNAPEMSQGIQESGSLTELKKYGVCYTKTLP